MSVVTLFMARHGAHDAVGEVLCGRAPGVPLGARGRREADALARRLSRERLDAVYSSPIERARETAQAVANACRVAALIEDALVEIDFGDWTGARFADLANRPDWRAWNEDRGRARPPNGESMAEVERRVGDWIAALRRPGIDLRVAAVSHGDVIKAAVCLALGLPVARLHRFEIATGSLTALVLHDSGMSLHTLNEIPSLEAPRP